MPSPSVPINISVLGTANHDGICVHRVRRWDRRDRLGKDRIPRTSVARTILDCAGTLPAPDLEQMVAKALRDHLVSNAKLTDVLERHPRRKGAGSLRALLRSRTPAFTRSETERRMLALVRKVGLPEPLTNARFGRYEPDFYWPDQRLIVEVDGYDFHSDRAAFERDRRRDAEMLADGIRTARVTWLQLCGESDDVARRLARALELN